MKNTFKVVSIALMTVFMFTATTCFGQSGGQTINSPEALKTYLDRQPVNGPDKPIRVTMAINDPMLEKVVDVINSLGKYVSLTISDNALTIIPDKAFASCKVLTSITIPNGVTTIRSDAFRGCTSLTSVTIPNSVKSIEVSAFHSCTSLTSVTIPNGVTSIEDIFYGCTNLTAINVDSGNTNYSSDNGVLFNKNKSTLIRYPEGKRGTYTIGNSVTSIGRYAFSDSSLTSITIPNGVTSIEDEAFSGCENLTSVTFQGMIKFHSGPYMIISFDGDLNSKYFAGGIGTYTTTAPVDYRSVWTKQ